MDRPVNPDDEALDALCLSAITEAEDEAEEEKQKKHGKPLKSPKDSVYVDIRDNDCASNKTPAALGHFNFFLKGYCEKHNFNRKGFPPITHIDQIPYEGLEGLVRGDGINSGTFWSDLFGKFFFYLAHQARRDYNEKKPLLKYDSGTGYASAVKTYLESKYRDKPIIPALETGKWRKLRNLHWKQCEQRDKKAGRRTVDPKIASTEDDRKAIANACILLGTAESAEFYGLNVFAFHLCGRGREVSTLKPEDLGLSRVHENFQRFQVISVEIQRDKEGKEQDLNIYPHVETLQEDPYFALIYMLIVGGFNNADLFPKFSVEGRRVQRNKNTSGVSAFWRLCFKNLHDEIKNFADTVNPNLTSYHGRKGANQKLAEIGSCSGLAQIFRTGWELRAFHSLFKYVVASKALTNQAGKALSGWNPDLKTGGHPPDVMSISTQPELLEGFTEALFSGDIRDQWPPDMRNLLTASLLRFYPEFILLIEQHPDSKYQDNSRHALVHSVNRAMRVANVENEVFDKWCKEVRSGFENHNISALPWDLVHNRPDMQLDPREMMDCYNTLVHTVHGIHQQKMRIEDTMHQLLIHNARQTQMLANQDQRILNLENGQSKIYKVLQMKLEQPSTEVDIVPPDQQAIRYFSDSQATRKKTATLKEIFVHFFENQCLEGYELEKNSAEFKAMLKGDKDKIKNLYKRTKHTIKVMLYFCDRYPDPIPHDPSSLVSWQRNLSSQADRAMAVLTNEIPDSKRITPASLMKAPTVKDWNNPEHPSYKTLPRNTPQSVALHFGVQPLPNNL